MPICIECRYPILTLYTTYSKADDKALGKGVRLTQCPNCKHFADKYVEHDFVVLFIDLVLIKPQVYRHLLFNRLGREYGRLNPSMIRLGLLTLLFDVYLTWVRSEEAARGSFHLLSLSPDHATFDRNNYATSLILSMAIDNGDGTATYRKIQHTLLQYGFFLFVCASEMLAYHLTIRCLLSAYMPRAFRAIMPYYPRPALVSTALLVSSFTRFFPLLLRVWMCDSPSSASAVEWAVVVNNLAALEILLDCGYVRASVLVAAGALCRAAAGWSITRVVGIDGRIATAGVVEAHGLIEVWRRAADFAEAW